MRLLITGATGFIGRHLLSRLSSIHKCYAVARPRSLPAGPSCVHWIEQDLAAPWQPERFPPSIDAVIHLAQSGHYKQFPEKAADIFQINVDSTFALLEYARRANAKVFLLASTGGLYGHGHEKFVETDAVNPRTFYFTSKYASELLLASYQRFFPTVVFRFFFVYGAGQKQMLFPTLMTKLAQGLPIGIEGNPGCRINPIHVQDAIAVFEPALRLTTSQLFNVAGDEIVTITELVQRMAKALGKPARIEYTDAPSEGDLIGDNSRMKEVLGVSPRIALAEGLRDMLRSMPAPHTGELPQSNSPSPRRSEANAIRTPRSLIPVR